MPSEMDLGARQRYLLAMVARVLTLLAVLAVVLAATVTPSHAVAMSAGAHHAHHPEMATGAMAGHTQHCLTHHDCGEADAGACAFVCAGLMSFVQPPDAGFARWIDPFHTAFSSGPRVESRTLQVTERPPKLRLL